MKRGTPSHPKLGELARQLKVARPTAGGLLEFLWHFAAAYAPTGDITGFTPAQIAEALGWPSRRAEELLAALITTRWLDQVGSALLVHDWPQHCDDAVHKYIATHRLRFADGTAPKLRMIPKSERMVLERYYSASPDGTSTVPVPYQYGTSTVKPLPLPLPLPLASAVASASEVEGRNEERSSCSPAAPASEVQAASKPPTSPKPKAAPYSPGFLAFWRAYPRKVGKLAAWRVWQRLKDRPETSVLIAAVEAQRHSDQWQREGGQYIPHPATWLNQGRWDDEAGSIAGLSTGPPTTGPRRGGFWQSELVRDNAKGTDANASDKPADPA